MLLLVSDEGDAPKREDTSPPPEDVGRPELTERVFSERGARSINVVGYTPVEPEYAPDMGGMPAPEPALSDAVNATPATSAESAPVESAPVEPSGSDPTPTE